MLIETQNIKIALKHLIIQVYLFAHLIILQVTVKPLIRPSQSHKLDYEREIVIIIGKEGRRISEDEAYDHIPEITIMNEGRSVIGYVMQNLMLLKVNAFFIQAQLALRWLQQMSLSLSNLKICKLLHELMVKLDKMILLQV